MCATSMHVGEWWICVTNIVWFSERFSLLSTKGSLELNAHTAKSKFDLEQKN